MQPLSLGFEEWSEGDSCYIWCVYCVTAIYGSVIVPIVMATASPNNNSQIEYKLVRIARARTDLAMASFLDIFQFSWTSRYKFAG